MTPDLCTQSSSPVPTGSKQKCENLDLCSTLLDVVVDTGAEKPVPPRTRTMRFVAASTIIGTFFDTNNGLQESSFISKSHCYDECSDMSCEFGEDVKSVESMSLSGEEIEYSKDAEVERCSVDVETSLCSSSKGEEKSHCEQSSDDSPAQFKNRRFSSSPSVLLRLLKAIFKSSKQCLQPNTV